MNLNWLRIAVFIGGIITLGFGIWHFFVPTLYDWGSYMVLLPDELMRGILATNFFLGFSLSIVGALTIIMCIWLWKNLAVMRLWVWTMVLLWAVRFGYQALNPQGQMVPGLAVVMLIIFGLTDLCFLIPALMLTRVNGTSKKACS